MKKMLLLGVGLALAAGLGWTASARAEPLDPAQVSAEAKWLAHLDVDAMRASTVVQRAWKKGLETCPGAQADLDKLRAKIGLEISKDVHGLTAYGMEPGKHTGVLIIHAKFDQKFLLDKAEKAPDHKVTKFESYDLHSWTAKHHGHSRTVWGAFYKPDCLVFASGVDELKGALDVLEGKLPGADDSPLKGDIKPGTTFLLRATGLSEAAAECKCQVAKYIRAVRVSTGENEGESFFSARVLTTSEERAGNLGDVVEGFKALAAWHVGDDARAKKLVDALHITTKGKALNIKWKAPADEVWWMLEKHAKWLAEQRAKMRWPGHKPAERPKEKEKSPVGPPHGPPTVMPLFLDYVKDLNLTDEQKAKIADIRKGYEPKFKEGMERIGSIPTAEQKKAGNEAVKAARAAGKRGRAVWEAGQAAMKLTDEQKTKMAEAQKQDRALFKEMGEKIDAVLTPEQREKVKALRPPRKEKKPENK
jgi:Spy/CpxP family protein refolding chaperone